MAARLTRSADHLIADACCVINLYASRCMSAVLQTVGESVAVAAYVRDVEATRLVLASIGPDGSESEAIDLGPMIDLGVLTVVSFQNPDEEETFLNFAAAIGDDGEAITAAIAVRRGWAMAIDDRKATNVLARLVPELEVVTTVDLLRHWVQQAAPDTDLVRQALRDIRQRARYAPGPRHPHYDWWQDRT